MRAILALGCLFVVMLVGRGWGQELPVAYESDFSQKSTEGWTFTDPDAWRFTDVEGQTVLEQHAASKYEPKVRSPLNMALAPVRIEGDMVMDVELRSTGRDYGHRDVCLFLGHQDPSHFYYVHMAKAADEHANSIFLVDGEPRRTIAVTRTDGTPWDDAWHHVRVIRRVQDGTIEVFFDDMKTPIMTAKDRTFVTPGRVGLGSFDDTAQFRKLTIHGQRAE